MKSIHTESNLIVAGFKKGDGGSRVPSERFLCKSWVLNSFLSNTDAGTQARMQEHAKANNLRRRMSVECVSFV